MIMAVPAIFFCMRFDWSQLSNQLIKYGVVSNQLAIGVIRDVYHILCLANLTSEVVNCIAG